MRVLVVLLILVALVMLSSPVPVRAQAIPYDVNMHLKTGMTEAEILQRCGPPTKEDIDDAVSGTKRYSYIGKKDEKITVIYFKRGKVYKIDRI